ncbi:redoxin domain-containing protein [Rubrivirga sp.]|uniref:redoxin domain-containing protein n=1 Tax=Rubrivirga sp. TaxID=1885344 RepID=UPI003C76E559
MKIRALTLIVALSSTAAAQIDYGGGLPLAGESFQAQSGSTVVLDAVTGDAGLVVVFWSSVCPWADRYEARLSELMDTYTPAGIGFVLVDSGDPALEDGSAAPPEPSTLPAPVIADTDGRLADAFSARSTPHIFFFGPDQTLLYDGTLDDSPAARERVRTPYLALAMDQSIAGLPVEIQRTQAFGCTIKRAGE